MTLHSYNMYVLSPDKASKIKVLKGPAPVFHKIGYGEISMRMKVAPGTVNAAQAACPCK